MAVPPKKKKRKESSRKVPQLRQQLRTPDQMQTLRNPVVIQARRAGGASRRRRRIFNTLGPVFDFDALGYTDRTAVFVRNIDTANGIDIQYGAGNTLNITRADGSTNVITGSDAFNVQPSEIAVVERDGTDVFVSIFPGKRISAYENYANANAAGPTAHDGIIIIRETGQIFARKTGTNSVSFPADGQANADWFEAGRPDIDVQTRILKHIEFTTVRSAGTNAGSNWTFAIKDLDGNAYAASDWAVSGVFTQYTGGTVVITYDKTVTNGTVPIGRNKAAPFVRLEFIGETPNGVSEITTGGVALSNTGNPITLHYEGTNYSDEWAGDPINWTTADQVTPTDQAAPWMPETEYPVGTIVSGTEQDPADSNLGELFNWRVTDAFTDTEFTEWDAGNFAAVQAKLERFAIGSNEAIDSSRVLPDGTSLGMDSFAMETGQTSRTYFVRAGESATFTKNSAPGIVHLHNEGGADVVRNDLTGPTRTELVVTGPAEVEYQRNSTQFDFIVTSHAPSATAKNALVYPVASFAALPVNDSGAGADGAVYKIPDIDALQITLPNKADMDLANGIWRARISGEWAGLSAQTTPLSFVDDTANGVEFGSGLPDSGNEWVDLVLDLANDKWIATTGGDVTLTQVIPTYTVHTEVPAAVRLWLIDGAGASAEGLYRKETVGDAPNYIG